MDSLPILAVGEAATKFVAAGAAIILGFCLDSWLALLCFALAIFFVALAVSELL